MDCIDKLLASLSKDWKAIFDSHPNYKSHMSPADEDRFNNATECDVCLSSFSSKN